MEQNINTQNNLSNESSPSIKMGLLGAIVIIGVAGYYYFSTNRNVMEVKESTNVTVTVATTTESTSSNTNNTNVSTSTSSEA